MRIIQFGFMLTALAFTTSLTYADDNFTARAEVMSAIPIYQQINQPRQECWSDAQSNANPASEHSYTGAVLGGLAGGLLGNTVGGGNGKIAATAVGAATGAMAGNYLGNQNTPQQPQQHCEIRDHYQQVLTGYTVTFRYNGQILSTIMPQKPGHFIAVNVHVAPAPVQSAPGNNYPQNNYPPN
jgi:uncharacterized protein YcfJ